MTTKLTVGKEYDFALNAYKEEQNLFLTSYYGDVEPQQATITPVRLQQDVNGIWRGKFKVNRLVDLENIGVSKDSSLALFNTIIISYETENE